MKAHMNWLQALQENPRLRAVHLVGQQLAVQKSQCVEGSAI